MFNIEMKATDHQTAWLFYDGPFTLEQANLALEKANNTNNQPFAVKTKFRIRQILRINDSDAKLDQNSK
jgi:hypothetical protein